jgi:predicted nucleic-acid-binding Zn-ribbon protein
MPLTSEQESKVKLAISPLLLRSCNVCGGRNWELKSEVSIYPMLDLQYKMPIEGRFYPVVLVTCSSCGNTLVFDAQKLGLL